MVSLQKMKTVTHCDLIFVIPITVWVDIQRMYLECDIVLSMLKNNRLASLGNPRHPCRVSPPHCPTVTRLPSESSLALLWHCITLLSLPALPAPPAHVFTVSIL